MIVTSLLWLILIDCVTADILWSQSNQALPPSHKIIYPNILIITYETCYVNQHTVRFMKSSVSIFLSILWCWPRPGNLFLLYWYSKPFCWWVLCYFNLIWYFSETTMSLPSQIAWFCFLLGSMFMECNWMDFYFTQVNIIVNLKGFIS